jgi:hypothetical protein
MKKLRSREDLPHPDISYNIWLTIILSGFLMFALYMGQGQTFQDGPDSFTVFALTALVVMIIGVQQSTGREDPLNNFLRTLGLRSPIPGFNTLLGTVGIGVGLLTHNLTSTAMSIWGGSSTAASIINPLYNPFTAFPTSFSISAGGGGQEFIFLIAFQLFVIASGEELFKMIGGKNIGNWIFVRTDFSKTFASMLGILFILPIWGVWHFLSWDMTIGSIFAATIYGFVFYVPWLFADYIGTLNEAQKLELSDMPLIPAISAHATWNILVATQGTGLSFTQNALIGVALIAIPTIYMLIIRRRFEIPLLPQP